MLGLLGPMVAHIWALDQRWASVIKFSGLDV